MYDYIEMVLNVSEYNKQYIKDGILSRGRSPLEVSYNRDSQLLKIKGSLPYFWQGHNFWYSMDDVERTIDKISSLLEVDLYSAKIKILEYGVIVCPDFPFKDFSENHLITKGYEMNTFGHRGKNYEKVGRLYTLKFYSVWANLDRHWNKVEPGIREMLKHTEYKKSNNPMRYEIHGNPQKVLNYRNGIYVSDLLSHSLEDEYQSVLLDEYSKIEKYSRLNTKGMQTYSAIWLLLTLLAETKKNYGQTIIQAIERLGLKADAMSRAKTEIRKRIKQTPNEGYSFSIEKLIYKSIYEQIKSRKE